LRLLLLFAAILIAPCLAAMAHGQQGTAREIAFPVPIQWNKQKGVTRYRLQIAADEKFRDVFFDGRVSGERYVVSGFPPGYYYWKVAPADSRLGEFSRPVRFFISGGIVTPVRLCSHAPCAAVARYRESANSVKSFR
jgi:hypothetical protein